MSLNIQKIREDFPVYRKLLKGKPVIYMDSACITLCPRQVTAAMNRYYEEYPACAGRSMHTFGQEVARQVENTRRAVQKFINAKKSGEIVFTKNTTESINLLANSLDLREGDTVLSSDKEHNSCLLPFQLLKKKKGINHRIFHFGDLADFQRKLTRDVKLVATAYTSNFDGTSNPVADIVRNAHANGTMVLIDGAQALPHREVDVRKLDIDFLAFSGHKMLGPSGTGVLYGKADFLEKLSMFLIGGDTVSNSTFETHEAEDIPARFEAGLQNYAGIIGLGEAIEYLSRVGLNAVEAHERELNTHLSTEFAKLGVSILGDTDPAKRSGIVSFTINGIGHHEVAGILNESANIMIRSGMHCVHSWCNANDIKGSARISLYIYNTHEECDIVIDEVRKIRNLVK